MNNTGYIEWIEKSFPECEVITMADILVKSIAVFQLFVVGSEDECQVVKSNRVKAPLVNASQEALFDKYDNFGCSPAKAQLKDGDIFYDMSDPSTAAIFYNNAPNICTYVQDGTMILRLKDKSMAQFLVWYINLEQVSLEIVNSHSDTEWGIETLEVPSADYFNSKKFLDLLETTSETGSRIAENAEKLLLRLNRVRESIVYEIPGLLSDESIKK